MTLITLTPEELQFATAEGQRRQSYNQARNIKGRNNGPDRGDLSLQLNILGCIGEYAAAKYFGLLDHLFTEVAPVRDSVDLPPNIDVKTGAKHSHRLIVKLDDCKSKIFVHSTCEQNVVMLHGWRYGHEVMKQCFVQDPVGNRAAYFVPNSVLKPIEQLRDYLVDLGYTK